MEIFAHNQTDGNTYKTTIRKLIKTTMFSIQGIKIGYEDFTLTYALFCIQTMLCIEFPGGSDGKASAYNLGDLGLIPGLGRFPGEGNGNPL